MNTKRRLVRILSTFLVSVMVLGIPATMVSAATIASDIEGHWAYEQITSWIDEGFIKGYPDGTFRPDANIARAELVALVNRAFDFEESQTISLTSIKKSKWYCDDITKAANAGYLEVYPESSEGLEEPITRQEVATIISKIMSLEKIAIDTGKFIDADQMPRSSKGYIGAVVKAGYMKGYPDGSFKPSGTMTRSEAIVALDSALQDVEIIEDDEVPKSSAKIKHNDDDDDDDDNNTNPDPPVTEEPEVAKITVDVSDKLSTLKSITVNSSTLGLKFMVEGSKLVKEFGEKVSVVSSEATLKVFILDTSGYVIGEIIVDVSDDNITDYEFEEIDESYAMVIVSVDVGDLSTIKDVKVVASTIGTHFMVEGSTLAKEFNNSIRVNTSDATVVVSILDLEGQVVHTVEVDVSSDGQQLYKVGRDSEPTSPPAVEKIVNISVEVSESLPTFKNITVNSSTIGTEFMIEGSTLVKSFGETISVITAQTTLDVSILNAAGAVIHSVEVDVTSDSTADYQESDESKDPGDDTGDDSGDDPGDDPGTSGETVNVTVDISESMSTFKNITVNSSTVGTKFRVEGSTLVKEVGSTITVVTSDTSVIVSLLDATNQVVYTVTVDVSSDNISNL